MRLMVLRRSFVPAVVAFALASLTTPACTEAPEPIQVSAGQIVLQNQSGQEWSNVEIWLNNHYRVQYPLIEPGQRFFVSLDQFVAASGQRFDRKRQYPQGIEVTAKDSNGREIRLVWGKGRIR